MSRTWTFRALVLAGAVAVHLGHARTDQEICGTHAEKAKEELFLHRQSLRKGASAAMQRSAAGLPLPEPRDAGNIVLIDDSNGVVGRRNPFDLNQRTLQFLPANPTVTSYRFQLGDASYDVSAAHSGAPLSLGDDSTQLVPLPFAFPFFGSAYQQIFVNSDGNATFTAGDSGSTDRSFGRLVGGVPRIAPLFTDLDPTFSSRGILVLSEPARFVVSWVSVPLYSSNGFGQPQTFQMRLYPDGRIEFAWSDAALTDAVVGISPGRSQGSSSVVSLSDGSSQEFSGAVGERFSGADSIDIVAAAQQFYATHEDAYDYLVIFNNEGLAAAPGAVAYEATVRNQRTGFGDAAVDIGQDLGSSSRLQAVMNMGPLSQYPVDPNAIVPSRFLSRDSPLSILGHEAGHLFLAYASVRDPNDPNARPMLGRQLAHWSFLFNSEASLLEGNRIQDNGPGVSPRFITTATVEGYAPLDQYLMGFRAPEEVPPTFLVVNSPEIPLASRSPQTGVSFNGIRRDIDVSELIDVVGRRTPDSTVSQRRFRFAFLLIVPAGSTPTAGQLAQIDTYRRMFEGYYARAASDRAAAETTLKRALHLSAFPAAGLVDGSMIPATLTLERPAAKPVIVLLNSESGAVALPPAAIVPAGATATTFYMMGLRPGVDTISAVPLDSSYETAFAKIQVVPSNASLHLEIVSRDPPVLRVTDPNAVPYPNIVVTGGTPDGAPTTSISDLNGLVRFPSAAVGLLVQIRGGPGVFVDTTRPE